ncbi:Clavaminate synthase-like protein [Zopfia rhizophila CBS 207.26]|uniref:Clavaminate synthase-like protein n=1 Tax=Zopfia rhizophila CBS 207.26 TaxID=1314779 RepID=A0A6A6E8Q4_9PEZI|nr:Clavaminate synthase-like protein [Zopfia rhizophila CBS 207.26]
MPSKAGQAPPILDFSAFYGNNAAAKQKLVNDVRDCCLHNGFFQITGHSVPLELQGRIMNWNKKFFDLPLEEKVKVGKDTTNTWNRGYEVLRSQILEPGTLPELKEGFYIGDEISTSHPYFINKKLNLGPNIWPNTSTLPDVGDFKATALEYYTKVVALAKDILKVLALTLDQKESWFDDFTDGAVATMRLLHYRTQPPDSPQKLTRGIGAHTDFGTITLLLQDKVAGLQVYDHATKEWLDVKPTTGALVVNLGNLMMRWSNDRYISNLHRVINVSGEERYSIPVFFSGNPDFVVECMPNCRKEGEEAKYKPITVEQAVLGGYADSYGRAEKFKKDAAEAARMSVAVAAPEVKAA